MRIQLLLVVLALTACKKEGPRDGAGPAASGSQKATIAGAMSAKWDFAQLDVADMKVDSALAYVEPNEITIELAGPGVAGVDCGHAWRDTRLESGQLAIALQTRGTKYSVPFNKKPGKLSGVGYTVYYRPKGSEQSTNSGNAARKDLPTELTIAKLDDRQVQGSFAITFAEGQTAKGRFTAKVCPR